jgi:uncharacterized membrane protein YuzA (DUF378 family)
MRAIDILSSILLVIGGLNWGLMGVANFNFVVWLFSTMPVLQHICYIVIGLAAVWQIVQFKEIRKRCKCK